MSGFSAEWLTLREPADLRARNAALREAVARHFAGREAITITDLGCGTGSTVRALTAALPPRQTWRLVDHDDALLAAARERCRDLQGGTITLEPRRADLASEIEAVIAEPTDLVTTSAFLDLVPTSWIDRLADALARRRLPFHAALTVDGHISCMPEDRDDRAVLAAFRRHQEGDKGLGAALGPAAARAAVAGFEARGYRVAAAPADWRLDGDDAALQAMLLAGWHSAASETGTLERRMLDGWHARRRQAIAAGVSRLRVGHTDIWAVPG